MTQAIGSSSYIDIVKETVAGTTPVTPAMVRLNGTAYGSKMSAAATENVSNAISGIRAVQDHRNSILGVSGSLSYELPIEGLDIVLRAIMGDTTVTGSGPYTKVHKLGAVLPSHTVEMGFPGVNQYYRYTGCKANKLDLAITPDGIITGTLDVMGMAVSNSATPLDASPTEFTHYFTQGTDVTTLLEGGSSAVKFSALNISITNDLEAQDIIGSKFHYSINEARMKVTGTCKIVFEDNTIWNKWLNETGSTLDLTITRNGKSIQIEIPNLKYVGEAGPSPDKETGIEVEFGFTGIYDATSESPIVITTINDIATVD